MSLVCAISGVVPEEPVVCPKSGYIFERRLIEKHLLANGNCCPITGDEMLLERDLVAIKVAKAVKPRPPSATSIPGLLSCLQSEWDSLMGESFALRAHVDTVRNQLSHSLYQHDAACRVIARLIRERDAARSLVATLQQSLASASRGVAELGLSEEVAGNFVLLSGELCRQRKQRVVEGTGKAMAKCKGTSAFAVHDTIEGAVACVTVDMKLKNRTIVSGGFDGAVVFFDAEEKKTICKAAGHMKKVNAIAVHPTECILVTGSDDRTIRIWSSSQQRLQYRTVHVLRQSPSEVTSLSFHPTNRYFTSSSSDGSWAFHELDSGRTLKTYHDIPSVCRDVKLHPDGLIVAGGGLDGRVHIWDIREEDLKASLEGGGAEVTSMSFSDNGYYLLSSSTDGRVYLWDLRKSSVVQRFDLSDGPIRSVAFDSSGSHFATAGDNGTVRCFSFVSRSTAELSVELLGHTGPATDVAFGPQGQFIASSSMDGTVRLWEPSD